MTSKLAQGTKEADGVYPPTVFTFYLSFLFSWCFYIIYTKSLSFLTRLSVSFGSTFKGGFILTISNGTTLRMDDTEFHAVH